MLSFFPQMHTNFRKYHLIICVNMCKSVDIITASAFLQLRPVSYTACMRCTNMESTEMGHVVLEYPFNVLLPCWLGLVLIGVVSTTPFGRGFTSLSYISLRALPSILLLIS